MKRSRGSGWFALAAVALALAGCSVDAPGAGGTDAPAYAAPTLAGDTLALSDLRGEAVVLNIWATWCPPCREEMPSLQQLHQQYQADGLRVVAVSIDNRSAAGEVRRFVEENGITFTILHDADERVTRTFRAAGVPETYLIDREGRLVQRWIGKIDTQTPAVQAAVRGALGLAEDRSS
jgi:peroxiredoxin